MMSLVAMLMAALVLVRADVYMHNPRGSNDRLNGGGQNRKNANRLFNSQNNAKGGYAINVGDPIMNFYERSWLTVEWTNQHACSNDNTDCTLVLQYMCGSSDDGPESQVRDGTTTDTIKQDNYDETAEVNGEKVFKYGMHESLDYKESCEARNRNGGLFIADRKLNGKNAQYTRQNNGGTRHGFECAEDKDYYPYWHPTPWKDVAVFTNDVSRCEWYQAESQNVKNKGHCEHAKGKDATDDERKNGRIPNNEAECTSEGHVWLEDSAFEIPPPDCLKAPWSRDNHLGNGITDTLSGHMNHYNWTLPSAAEEPCISAGNCRCVLRLRYNTSTTDYQMFGDRAGYGEFVDHLSNGKGEKALIEQDPTLSVAGKPLSHAVNTNQISRTFQDRSHAFSIRSRPAHITGNQRILNVNVRGKRGNIVQTYPAVEYDFTPTHLIARAGDFVHFQWTGFDNNPNNGNNNGEGTDGTDRSNICQIGRMGDNHCMCDTEACYAATGVDAMIDDAELRHRLAYLDQAKEDCKSYEELMEIHNNNKGKVEKDERNCMKLNAASTYQDFDLVKLTKTGSFFYMSSRNNNFSNRSQKGSLTIIPLLSNWAIAAVSIGSVVTLASIGIAALVLKAKSNPDSGFARMFDKI